MSKNTTPKGISYPSLAEVGQRTHTEVIQGFIVAGESKTAILDAYVIARFPEVEAGTLLRENHGATARVMSDDKAISKAKALLRKHGNTHYKLAKNDLDPEVVAERKAKAAAAVERLETQLANAKAKAGQQAA